MNTIAPIIASKRYSTLSINGTPRSLLNIGFKTACLLLCLSLSAPFAHVKKHHSSHHKSVPDAEDERKLSGNVILNINNTTYSEESEPPTTPALPVAAIHQPAPLTTTPSATKPTVVKTVVQNELEQRLTPSTLNDVRARLRHDPTFLLRQGTIIPCVLKTRIISTYPGLVSCYVSKDVYSANGKVLLIDRGSEIIGEQRTALMHGQSRIFVLWSHLETPNGVAVDLNSPATEALGATGLDAKVDNHFWERFGNVIFLSLIDDAAAAIATNNNTDSNTVYLNNTSSLSQIIAAKVLESTVNIPPTGYTQPGAIVNVFVARDVDFKPVYELKYKATKSPQ